MEEIPVKSEDKQTHDQDFPNIHLRLLDLSDIDDYMVGVTDDKVNQFCSWDGQSASTTTRSEEFPSRQTGDLTVIRRKLVVESKHSVLLGYERLARVCSNITYNSHRCFLRNNCEQECVMDWFSFFPDEQSGLKSNESLR
ncbi:hypothetical protein RHGRI_003455 [Rhododendron griersonianum]|uniref:Uncharacterized protein n=1 Tax=Rhododendron griersonianum TaxID=479676 RepID=A0AAV6L6X8_9ERIC|nr:hypothetical protein RHGRI_003455 [Rhododendron griersonianum]